MKYLLSSLILISCLSAQSKMTRQQIIEDNKKIAKENLRKNKYPSSLNTNVTLYLQGSDKKYRGCIQENNVNNETLTVYVQSNDKSFSKRKIAYSALSGAYQNGGFRMLYNLKTANCFSTQGTTNSQNNNRTNYQSVSNTREQQEALSNCLTVAAGVLLLGAAAYLVSESGSSGYGGYDYVDYHWDQFYDENYNLVWRCRTDGGQNSGQFAPDSECALKIKVDTRWPSKSALGY